MDKLREYVCDLVVMVDYQTSENEPIDLADVFRQAFEMGYIDENVLLEAKNAVLNN